MEPQRPSRSAEFIASRRALHQLLDRPLVLDDPLAIKLLSPENRHALAAIGSGSRPAGAGVIRAWVAARSRYCEDALASAVAERGVGQCVILGAGFDTLAYRRRLADSLRIFEVDFPASQALKRERLRAAGIAEPPSLTFVPVDLQEASLVDVLVAAGASCSDRVFFSALGLLPYLRPEVIHTMFRAIAAAFPPGSEIAFDYAPPPDLLPPQSREASNRWQALAQQAGEQVISFVLPSDLRRTLVAAGFRQVEQLDFEATNGRYFFARDDDLRVGPGLALARAAV